MEIKDLKELCSNHNTVEDNIDTMYRAMRNQHWMKVINPSNASFYLEDDDKNVLLKHLENKKNNLELKIDNILNPKLTRDTSKTVYIAGKITGLPDYRQVFALAEARLNLEGHLCMNPSTLPEGFPWEAYMPICYAMIDACEAIYMLPNWNDSRGARLEHDYAVSKGKEVIYG
jgi:hypothetical protein